MYRRVKLGGDGFLLPMDAAGVRVHGGMEEACLRLGEDSEPWNQGRDYSSGYDEEEAGVHCQHGPDCKLPPSWGTTKLPPQGAGWGSVLDT